MLAKEIQVVHLFVTTMVMLLLLVLSVGAMDVLLPTILEYMPEPHLPFPGFRIVWDHVPELPHPHLLHHLPPHPHPLVLQVMDVETLHGKVTIIAMTKTTMQIVNMMVEIAVEMMSTPNTALHVNVWIPMNNLLKLPLNLPLNLQKMLVDLLNGLVIVTVMMKITMKNVAGMVEIVVAM